MAYTTNSPIPQAILDEIVEEVQRISYGSVEIYIQDKQITQITVRNIKKTMTNGNGHSQVTNSVKSNIVNQNNKIRVLTIKK